MRSTALRSPPTADALASARAAGLRHFDDTRPGFGRRSTGRTRFEGKRRVAVFAYHDDAGRPLRNVAALERIRRLAIPPAWRDVWICPSEHGHIQATGRDARGRKQYRYHARWREERDATKYGRMIAFGKALPALRRRVAADLARRGLPRAKVLAAVVRLLETTFIRVGNEEYARSNRSFGLTTLEDHHVAFHASALRFHFRGKSGVVHDVAVHDRRLARIVRQCRDLPGQELFQYLDEVARPATIDSGDVNDYIHAAAGENFTAKDFRTWAGTVLAARALDDLAALDADRPPRRPTNADVRRAVEQVAARLGNTPAVCRRCYVHPEIVAAYLEGARAPARARRASSARRDPAGLRPDEAAVLALLVRRRHEDRGSVASSGRARSFRRSDFVTPARVLPGVPSHRVST